MGELMDAIDSGDRAALLDAVRNLTEESLDVDPRGDDDPGPIPGESFDDVTNAWIMGKIPDATYEAAIVAAASSPESPDTGVSADS
jgi:hypothetical protein